jgi:phosphatidyl-myo-inositol alpha-mannosyltransferase
MAYYLADGGHEVTVVSSSVGRTSCFEHPRISALLLPKHFAGSRSRWLNSAHSFALACHWIVRHHTFDVVHCLNYHDAFGALLARGWIGSSPRIVLQINGIPVRRYFRSIPHDYFMFRYAVRHADAVVVLSRCAQDALEREFGQQGILIPSPTETDQFLAVSKRRCRNVCILFVGDATERRKGAIPLAKAFATIHERRPGAVLRFSGRLDGETRQAILEAVPPALHGQVELLGIGAVDELPKLYAEATVVVNPALWEALGNVLIEGLASGTPVVGCRHGGIPDIITDPHIGVLFDPGSRNDQTDNISGIADAVLAAAELAARPETERRCRNHAQSFSWNVLGPCFEALYV